MILTWESLNLYFEAGQLADFDDTQMYVQDPLSDYQDQRLIKYKTDHPVYNIPCSEHEFTCSRLSWLCGAVEMTTVLCLR